MGVKEAYKRISKEYHDISKDIDRLNKEFLKTGDMLPSTTAIYFRNGIETALDILGEECPEVKEDE